MDATRIRIHNPARAGLGTFGRAGRAVVSKAGHMVPKDASWERGCNGHAAAFRPSTQAGWTRCVCARALAHRTELGRPSKEKPISPLSRPDGLREEVGTMTCPSRCFLEDILPWPFHLPNPWAKNIPTVAEVVFTGENATPESSCIPKWQGAAWIV